MSEQANASAETAANPTATDQGTPVASTQAHGATAGHHAEPSTLGFDATGWVSIAMTLFILVLLVKKVPAIIGGALDKKIAGIRNQLDEAKTLRAEAEALRNEYAAKIKTAEIDAIAMRNHAQEEAQQILAGAKVQAQELTARRVKMAEDKIGAAERAAIAEVRAHAANAAIMAASSLIAQGHGATQDKSLVDETIAGLGTRLN